MKKVKFGLLISTVVLGLIFVVTLFNPFRDEDLRKYGVENYFEISIVDKENKYDEEYLYIEIKNISGEDVYNTDVTFGRRANEYTSDNYIWFRIAKITKGDTVKISLYEDTGEYKIGSKSSTSNPSTYSISISPKADQLELDQCMRIDSITIDSDEPNVYSLDARYWSWEKILFASLTFVSGIALLVIYIIEKKNYINV